MDSGLNKRGFLIRQEREQKRQIAKEEVYAMNKSELRRELLKYKYDDIDNVLLSNGLNEIEYEKDCIYRPARSRCICFRLQELPRRGAVPDPEQRACPR